MTIQDVIKKLITAENYAEVRVTISDDFINFVKEMLSSDYEYFKDKEEAYQKSLESKPMNLKEDN